MVAVRGWHSWVVGEGPVDERYGGFVAGNMNRVCREGDTVVRGGGPWTPTVHRYLDHLGAGGVDWVPRPIDIMLDAGGVPVRERLSYLPGDVPAYPLPAWVWSDEVLCDGARRLRCLHDASVGFVSGGEVWQSPSRVPAEVVCHNDFAPHNHVFRDGRIVGAIDFDFCSPGPRLWDIAYFATRIVPLCAVTPPGAPGIDDARRRVALMLEAYGGSPFIGFDDVIRVAIVRLHDLGEFSRRKAEELCKPHLLDDALEYDRDGRYLAALLR